MSDTSTSVLMSMLFLQLQIGCPESYIMSSCVQPLVQTDANPVALLHCFDRLVVFRFEIIISFSCFVLNLFHYVLVL